jgi:hypothetical protein
MEQEEDYFAPLGMSHSDFNSMLRRRNLANLTQHLIEQGRVTLPGTGTGTSTVVPSNTAQLVKVEDGVADFPEPLVADVEGEDVTRKSSSFYCRGIDEDSPRFAMFFDRRDSRSIAAKSQSPTSRPISSRKRSKRVSLSSFFPGFSKVASVSSYSSGTAAPKKIYRPLESDTEFCQTPRISDDEPHSLSSLSSSPPVTSSTTTSVSSYNSGTAAPKAKDCLPLPLQSPVKEARRISASKLQAPQDSFPATSWSTASVDTYCSGTAGPKAEYCPVKRDPWFYKTPHMPGNETHSLPAAASALDKARASYYAQQQHSFHGHAGEALSQASQEADLDLPKAIAALLRKYAQLEKLQEEQPPVDRIVELGRLRRVIRTLNFSFDDAILLASDLTTLVPVPGDDVADLETCMFFRRRLARTVWGRVESLRLELRVGDALKIEHWYKDVVDLVGWLDEYEARMPWSWLERDGFF